MTGHHALYMSCLIAILTSIAGLEGIQQIITGALLLGLVMALFPALMQPTLKRLQAMILWHWDILAVAAIG